MHRLLVLGAVMAVTTLAPLSGAGEAHAQERVAPMLGALEWSPRSAVSMTSESPTPASLDRVLLGSTLGTVAGVAAGAAVGVLIFLAENPDAAMFGPLPHMVLIGVPAGALGSFVGTRYASGGAGNAWLTALGAVTGAAAGIGLGYVIADPSGSVPLGLVIGVPIAIALPALVEVATSR